MHLIREAGMQTCVLPIFFYFWLEITIFNFVSLGLFLKVTLKFLNGYHFNLVK